MSGSLHISISAETIFYFLGIPISNSMFTSVVISCLLLAFGVFVKKTFNSKDIKGRPHGLQNFIEAIIEALYNFVYSITHSHEKTKTFFPFFASFFFFIIFNNWFGLLPGVGSIGITSEPRLRQGFGGQAFVKQVEASEISNEETHLTPVEHKKFIPIFRAGTADLNTTLALAIITFFLIQFFGIKYLHLSYFKKFINFSSPIMFFVGILETVSEFAKIISFTFRLFGNIFAGEVLLAVIAFLVPVIVPMPFYGLEIFVGFIQALVFSMLSLVFYNMATSEHEEH